tara:strand:- start:5601 stop:6752 length:1152 start_codon:yes stop_codon:yes gene_type:complete
MISDKKNHLSLKVVYFLFFFLLLFPKISIISLPGYKQGIRIEDLVTFVLLLFILYNYKKFHFLGNSGEIKFFLFTIFIFFSYLIGVYNGVSIEIFSVFRIIEYFTLLIFFSTFYLDKNKITRILKLVIILNLLIILAQYFEIIGYFSSTGYTSPKVFGWKATGVFSGQWELSFVISVCYLIIFENQKKKFDRYFFLTVIIIYLSGTKSVQLAFIISILYTYFKFYFNYLSIIKVIIFISLFILLLSLVIGYYNMEVKYLLTTLYDLFMNNTVPQFTEDNVEYSSWIHRLHNWQIYYSNMQLNIFTFLFGVGYMGIYYESFIFRILFGNGILGLLILFIFVYKINFSILLFLLISGITLDFIASFKIFLILYLYFKMLPKNSKI